MGILMRPGVPVRPQPHTDHTLETKARAGTETSQAHTTPFLYSFGTVSVYALVCMSLRGMACINDLLPVEILDTILLGSVPEPMRLVLGRVCALWRGIVLTATSRTGPADTNSGSHNNTKDGLKYGTKDAVTDRVDDTQDESMTNRWQRLEAYAAHTDALGLFEWFDTLGRPRAATACINAAAAGRTSTLAWLVERGWPINMDVYKAGAMSPDDDTIKWLVARPDTPPLTDNVLRAALRAGSSVARLDWLVDQAGAPWPTGSIGALWSAAQSGMVEVVEWAARRGPQPPLWHDAVHGASLDGHIALLDYLEAAGHMQDAQGNNVDLRAAFWGAASQGQIDALAWLAERRPALVEDATAMQLAATEGKTDVVRWLVERCKERDPTYTPRRDTVVAAARHGHLDTLCYLCGPVGDGEHAKPLAMPTSDVYFAAAAADRWHVVEWAAAAGVPWDVSGIARWILNRSVHSAQERERCVRLIDRGFWRCAPWMRDVVVNWPRTDAAADQDATGRPGGGVIIAGAEYLVAALARAMGSDSTVTFGHAAGLFGVLVAALDN
nr:ankyrin repeat [Pandoravirus massiliensis]